jgi:hypothetical protein
MISLSKFDDSQKEVLEKMQKAYKLKRLIPFVGAGFSKNITNYPDWDKFIKQLGDDIHCNLSALFRNNNLEACEYFIYKRGKGNFTEGKKELLKVINNMVVRNQRNATKNDEWALHDKFVSKFDYIYTTNWDNTLEQAVPNPPTKVVAFFKRSHLSVPPKKYKKYANDSIQVIKLHGNYKGIKAESLIACQRDYNQRIIEQNPFDIKFKNDLLHNNFFFIGYNFGDPNILLMIDLIQQITQGIPQKKSVNLFWISIEPFDDERVCLLKKSMQIRPYHLLTACQQKTLDQLKKQLKQKCDKCVVKKKTGAHDAILFDLCKNCSEPEISNFKETKRQFIKKQTEVFLDEF